MKWQDKRLPWWAVGAGLAAFAIIAFILIQRQNNDLAMLERTYEAVNARRITLQSEQSEKQREYNISNSPEYIAARARENGYTMPNELHFVVDNPEVLADHETLDQVQLSAIVQPVLPKPGQEASDSEAAEETADEEPAVEVVLPADGDTYDPAAEEIEP